MPIPATPEPAARTLARDEAYARIREAILTGVILPGERLDETELTTWLGVSSTPVRQALYALTLEGFVETAPQSYTRVVTPHVEDALEHLQALGTLVLGHMLLTLPALPDPDLHRLTAELQVVRDQLAAHDLAVVATASETYYLDLVGLCRNRPLRRMTEQMGVAMAYYVTAVHTHLEFDRDGALALYDAQLAALRERRFTDAVAAAGALFGLVPSAELALDHR